MPTILGHDRGIVSKDRATILVKFRYKCFGVVNWINIHSNSASGFRRTMRRRDGEQLVRIRAAEQTWLLIQAKELSGESA